MESVNELTREDGIQTQYLTFTMAQEDFAVGILKVKEIIEYDTLTKVPSLPISVRGVINLRGSVVPVVDLAVKFGLAGNVVTKRTCIVIVEVIIDGEKKVMGIIADAVNQVMELQASDIGPPPSFGTQVRVDFLQGMGKVGKGFVQILDVNKVLSTFDLSTLEAIHASPVKKESAGDREEKPVEGGSDRTDNSSRSGEPE